MTAASTLSFAALNFDSSDPAAMAEFWGNVLGRPFGPGALAGDMAVDATDQASGPRLVLHPAADVPQTIKNGLRPVLLTRPTRRGNQAVDRPGRHRGDAEHAATGRPRDHVRRPGGQRVRFGDFRSLSNGRGPAAPAHIGARERAPICARGGRPAIA